MTLIVVMVEQLTATLRSVRSSVPTWDVKSICKKDVGYFIIVCNTCRVDGRKSNSTLSKLRFKGKKIMMTCIMCYLKYVKSTNCIGIISGCMCSE